MLPRAVDLAAVAAYDHRAFPCVLGVPDPGGLVGIRVRHGDDLLQAKK